MVDRKPDKNEQQHLLPIPTYDEAISSRPSSSHSFLGPQEVSHDAERQGLLTQRGGFGEYRHPQVESARDSLDSLVSDDLGVAPGHDRAEILQMDFIDADAERETDTRSLMSGRLSKRFTSLTSSLSSIHLPFRQWLPSWDYINSRADALSPRGWVINWILVCRLFAIIMVMLVVYLLVISDLFKVNRRHGRLPTDPEFLKAFVRDNMNATSIREYLRYLTSYDHMAGTAGGLSQAQYIENLFSASHLEDVGLERFDVYLNFPKDGGRTVSIVDPEHLAWSARIEEEMVYTDGRAQVPVFHGHSRSGNATGPLIYANYGSRADFDHLKSQGIDLDGAIVLVRYYGTEGDRALKIHAAYLAGAVGCIIYSDPADDGFVKGPPFPEGPFMPKDGVQRGAVSLMSWVVGDILTPGYASLPDEPKREPLEESPGLNKIPSIPLSWGDAQVLLQALKGHGTKLGNDWGIGGVPDVEWWTGDQSSPKVLLRNHQDEVERSPIYNVLGRITGTEQPDKSVIVGNHHDAWCFGAADPGSGSAIMLEVIKIFGQLREMGWRPLRTIEFASWDGEEYNLIGSTEHVENRLERLRRDGLAYINVDVGVVGQIFDASASPILSTALLHALERVPDPAGNGSLRDSFVEKGSKIDGLGAGSDFVAFQDMAGTSSLDMSFEGLGYPYHSCYDNFEWMQKFGDPDFEYHRAMAQIWALLILDLSDRELLPLDLQQYANSVAGYVSDLEDYVVEKGRDLDMSSLHDAVNTFIDNARVFHEWDLAWSNLVYGAGGGFESGQTALKRMDHNTRMAKFETDLLDVGGGVRASPPVIHEKVERLTCFVSCLVVSNSSISYLHHKPGTDTMPNTSPASEMPSRTGTGNWPSRT